MPAVLPGPPKEIGATDLSDAITDYLKCERTAKVRHEFYYGGTTQMPGGTYEHGLIATNFAASLVYLLRNDDCAVIVSDIKVFVEPGVFYYPDVSVACGKPQIDFEESLQNPVVLIEVLSKSTQKKDRGEKKREYQRIVSLQHYVLVEQNAPRIEHYDRDASGNWPENPAITEGVNAALFLSALGVSVPLADIYRRILFA